LRIAQWKANGLQQHKEEVKLFLNQNQIDILLISETHNTTKNHFTISGYDLCYTNHPDGTAHGGTAIIIKNTIAHYVQLKYTEPVIQATSVRVKGPLCDITIAAVYCPQRYNLKAEHFEAFFQTLGQSFLDGGDFNSKHTLWGSRLTTTKGRELAKVIQAQNNSYLSYWPTDANKIPDLLDFFITNGISTTYADVQASYDLTSNHTPIIVTISTTIVVRQPALRLHTSHTN
jgi:exonuclease III